MLIIVPQGVEKMKKFFLCFLGARDELDIVHNKHVILTVLVFEIIGSTISYGINVINGEALRSDVEHFFVCVLFLKVIPDCLNEVGFAVTGLAVNEKRIIGKARALQDCFGGGVGELVEWSDHKCIKCIARIEIVALVYIETAKID